jgi:hypothetical protein
MLGREAHSKREPYNLRWGVMNGRREQIAGYFRTLFPFRVGLFDAETVTGNMGLDSMVILTELKSSDRSTPAG